MSASCLVCSAFQTLSACLKACSSVVTSPWYWLNASAKFLQTMVVELRLLRPDIRPPGASVIRIGTEEELEAWARDPAHRFRQRSTARAAGGKTNRWIQGPGIGLALVRQALDRALSLAIKTPLPSPGPSSSRPDPNALRLAHRLVVSIFQLGQVLRDKTG